MKKNNTKVIAMYLPQYHEIPENSKWWGEGFTDWVSVKDSTPLYEGHRQPRRPLNDNYYDLTQVENIKWQVELAKANGIYGFGIYHYWFSSDLKVLEKPAELLLENTDIEMPFFFAWDNNSWVRTWSKYKHNTNAWSPKYDQKENIDTDNGVLAQLEYGDEKDWKIHFDYLLQFFKDVRYIKIDNKPVFIIWNYHKKDVLSEMCQYWNKLAKEEGFDGMYLISRLNPYDSMEGFDALFTYEPMFTAWQNKNIVNRVYNKLKDYVIKKKKLVIYDYDKVWKRILMHARKNEREDVMYGGFVSYDDTPRRGASGKVIKGETPEKFCGYMKELLDISCRKNKKFVFLMAWNEWGEGAYLEPDTFHEYKYLEALKEILVK